ncbi:MAG: Rne/Rng family ribonuclease [Sphingomonadaceae bacterium]
MSTRMLIDARHAEETRVAVLKGNRIEEFDFESSEHKQIKGNIYLAKVTRVEPSLQAAFVDFGGNRHGFLAFSEIHPDYYQIPLEDREALLAEEAAHAEEEAALRAADEEDAEESENTDPLEIDEPDEDSSESLAEDLAESDGVEEIDTSEKDDVATIEEGQLDETEDNETDTDEQDEQPRRRGRRRQGRGNSARAKEADALRAKRMALRRRYKIQDVIHRRQVLLVQVVKEERGNKGAALTSYLSLAGRYCVLMPNSSHGGGISRKISNAGDRKRLKQVVSSLSLPRSMGLIVRTAGLQRTKTEIKRDFDYLARLWDEIREKTLSSSAPTQIHSDSDLIKRAIRDIYNRDIEEVVVEGETGYRSAKEFMKLLMPSHARRVKAYSDPMPLFQRYGAEDQLRAMYDPMVQLKSGGYLVINPTEALVSIDINSGRSTKEHGIEATALSTNLEAAREIARQLRLRDMAGLVVIDFIDMEYNSNIRKVERAMKEALKSDRARIQVGRISGFGLMEMSRQRLRTGVLEATTRECPHCDGTGLVRTASSAGLSALRLIEDEAAKGRGSLITLSASTEATIYLLNAKRNDLQEIEQRFGVRVEVLPEGEDEGAKMSVASSGPRPANMPEMPAIIEDDDIDDEDLAAAEASDYAENEDGEPRKKRRRRRRGGRGRKKREAESDENGNIAEDGDENPSSSGEETPETSGPAGEHTPLSDNDDEEAKPKKRRRRARRGSADSAEIAANDTESDAETGSRVKEPEGLPDEVSSAEAEAEKPRRRRTRRKKDDEAPVTAPETVEAEAPVDAAVDAGADAAAGADVAADIRPKPKRTRRKKVETTADTPAPTVAEAEADAVEAPAKPKRTRRKKVDAVAETPDKPEKRTASPANAEAAASVAAANTNSTTGANPSETAGEAPSTPRRGWWQRTFGQ